jgi:hypothetical protein
MHKHLSIIQANLGKRKGAQLSILNDASVKDFAIIMITEPNIMSINERTVVHEHSQWSLTTPTLTRKDSTTQPFRSLMYVNKKETFQQIKVPDPDITAGVLRTNTQQLLVVSIYVQRDNSISAERRAEDLTRQLQLITSVWKETIRKCGDEVQLMVGGDFNRHDQLWGGDAVATSPRQGEGNPILEWMGKLGLKSMLPRGTKTFQRGTSETTIDLVIMSAELAERTVNCNIHPTDHGSDHHAITTTLQDQITRNRKPARINYRKSDWEAIRLDLAEQVTSVPAIDTIDKLESQTERLINLVQQVTTKHTPRARPSPYMKAWWDDELSSLRLEFTTLRNRLTNATRYGYYNTQLEELVKRAKRRFHTSIRDKKRKHWHTFLEEPNNIWKAAKYCKPTKSAFDKIPMLKNGTMEIEEDQDKADLLLKTFFPPSIGGAINTTPVQSTIPPIRDNPELTAEEVGSAVQTLRPWKAPGIDGIPNMVWKETWPTLQKWILTIFNASIRMGVMPAAFKTARMVPLRKPQKPDYTIPESYRPISLLSTLGKILESVVARRLSYWAETRGLLPDTQFGARPLRSCEQALTILVGKIKDAWRKGKVLSLVSYDVKGAYNGVSKEVLVRALSAKGIPENTARWIKSFCSDRKATMMVNGTETEAQEIQFPGLPQGVVL